MQNAFPLNEVVERPMSRAMVLAGAAVLLSVLAKGGRRNRSGGMHSNRYPDRASFKQFELAANNLKTATKKVDNSAAAVEVALKVLTAA
jgi:hypothetical protein